MEPGQEMGGDSVRPEGWLPGRDDGEEGPLVLGRGLGRFDPVVYDHASLRGETGTQSRPRQVVASSCPASRVLLNAPVNLVLLSGRISRGRASP